MKIGVRGVQVSELQADLHKAGFDPGPRDGVFGPVTERAVKASQQVNGLVVDGIVGPKTQAALTGRVNVRPKKAEDRQVKELQRARVCL